MSAAASAQIPDDEEELIPVPGAKPEPPQWSGKPEELEEYMHHVQMWTKIHGPIVHSSPSSTSSWTKIPERNAMNDSAKRRATPVEDPTNPK
jgi:hypothetical protein